MSFFDKLSSIFKIDISKLKEIHLFSDNKTVKIEHHDHRTININIGALSPQKSQKIREVIKEAVQKEEQILLETDANQLLENFSYVDKQDQNRKEIEFYRGKIPAEDIDVLRAAIFIQEQSKQGKSVRELKEDVRLRYGQRGNNIVNLYTAGYFYSVVRPMYEEMASQSDFSQEKFIKRYNTIVMQYTFAVFVNARMSSEELEKEVHEKIVKNKKYGISHLNIHGIGSDNVAKIQELLAKLKGTIRWPPDIDSERGFITVKIAY